MYDSSSMRDVIVTYTLSPSVPSTSHPCSPAGARRSSRLLRNERRSFVIANTLARARAAEAHPRLGPAADEHGPIDARSKASCHREGQPPTEATATIINRGSRRGLLPVG